MRSGACNHGAPIHYESSWQLHALTAGVRLTGLLSTLLSVKWRERVWAVWLDGRAGQQKVTEQRTMLVRGVRERTHASCIRNRSCRRIERR